MNGWDQLIARLTQPLEVDQELRLDVARELRCHLEDSAAEFRAAGESPPEAAASATKALGDEQELTEQLWEANRARIRLRGMLRWTARVTLLPAALLVTLLLLTYLVGISGGVFLLASQGQRGGWAGWPMGPLGKLVCDPYMGVRLTTDQRWLLFGDPNAKTELEKAKSITDRWPDDPVYYANYIAYLLTQREPVRGGANERPRVDEEKLAEVLAALRRSEQIDPNNAFYTLMIASLLIRASSILQDDPSVTYDMLAYDGRVTAGKERIIPVPVDRIEIVDAKRFDQGLEEFPRGLAKLLVTTHSAEMLRLRLDMLPAPFRLVQYLGRVSMYVSTLLPGLRDYRTLSRSLLAYARQLAAQGQGERALRVPEDLKRLAAKLGAQADCLVELLVAQAIRHHAFAYEEVIARELGRANAAEAARQQRMEEDRFLYHIRFGRDVREAELVRMSFLETLVSPRLPGYEADTKPLRITEQFVFAQLGLLGVLVGLLLACAYLGLVVVCDLVFLPKADRPVLLFVGWGRLGRICLLGVVVPVAVYGCYVFAMGAWAPTVGLLVSLDRVCVEFLALGGVVLVLLIRLSRTAIARRAGELGMGAPLDPFWRAHPWWTAVLAILGAGLLAYFVGWWAGPFRRMMTPGTGNVDALMILFVIVCLGLAIVDINWMFRATKRGMEASTRPFWRAHPRLMAVLTLMGMGLLGYLVGWWVVVKGYLSGPDSTVFSLLFGLPLATLIIISWRIRQMKRGEPAQGTCQPESRRFSRSLQRSLIPILAAAVIVLGVALGGLLAAGEGYAIRQTGTGMPMPDEIAHSDFRLLKDHFVELDKAFQRQEASPADQPGR